jgi:hypothetical protein
VGQVGSLATGPERTGEVFTLLSIIPISKWTTNRGFWDSGHHELGEIEKYLGVFYLMIRILSFLNCDPDLRHNTPQYRSIQTKTEDLRILGSPVSSYHRRWRLQLGFWVLRH